jgi:hypothetical protein
VQYHDAIGLCLGDFGYKLALVGGQVHVLAVVAFGFVAVGQANEQHAHVAFPSQFHRFGQQGFVGFVRFDGEALRVGGVGEGTHHFLGGGYLVGVDVGAAAPLEARFFKEFADEGHFFILGQGQDGTVVFK